MYLVMSILFFFMLYWYYIYISINRHISIAGNYVDHQVIHDVCVCVLFEKKNSSCQIYSLRWSNSKGLLVNLPLRSQKKFILDMSHVHCSNCFFFLLVHPHFCCWLNLISMLLRLKETGTFPEYVWIRIWGILLIRK